MRNRTNTWMKGALVTPFVIGASVACGSTDEGASGGSATAPPADVTTTEAPVLAATESEDLIETAVEPVDTKPATPDDGDPVASVHLDIRMVALPVAAIEAESASTIEGINGDKLTAMPDRRLFATGSIDFADATQPLMWTSADGMEWQLVDIGEDGVWRTFDLVVASDDGYEAIATSIGGGYDGVGTIEADDVSRESWSSTDGLTWTLDARVSTDEPVDERFDDTNWWPGDIERPPADCPGGWYNTDRLIETDTGLVAFCQVGSSWLIDPMYIWELTDDGWQQIPDPDGVFDGAAFDQVIATDAGYLALGVREVGPDPFTAAVWWSEDARRWTPVTLDDEMFGDDARIGDAVLVGDAVVMLGGRSSTDPVVWIADLA